MHEKHEKNTILLVDDSKLCRLTGKNTISKYFGFTVITAESGDDAVAKYKLNADEICLITMDFEMPVKGSALQNGVDTAIAIRELSEDKTVPIVFNTSSPHVLIEKLKETKSWNEEKNSPKDDFMDIFPGKALNIVGMNTIFDKFNIKLPQKETIESKLPERDRSPKKPYSTLVEPKPTKSFLVILQEEEKSETVSESSPERIKRN